MRIFWDANVLFSAAKSAGSIRQLLHDLHADGQVLVADECVVTISSPAQLALAVFPSSRNPRIADEGFRVKTDKLT